MLKLHHFFLLVSLLADGGTPTPAPSSPTPSPPSATVDAGTPSPPPDSADSIRWPKEFEPLAVLDGRAVMAAHAALQRVLARYPKEYAASCSYSAKSMDVVVAEQDGLYFVRIDQRADRCGWGPPGVQLELDWFELYAVSPDGRVLARYPHMP